MAADVITSLHRARTEFLRRLPKAELHLHIEGTLEPELMLTLAERNGVAAPFANVEAARAAYRFADLQGFLDLYYRGMSVLHTDADFADLAAAYLERAADEGIVHAELFFDPQAHSGRGIALETVLSGLTGAMAEAEARRGISSVLIPCFLRDRGAEAAMACWEALRPHAAGFAAIGLDSAEVGHPPEPFAPVFAMARAAGLRTVAHAGEEGPAAYIRGALDALKVDRIDHGIRCIDDPSLMAELAARRVPLTVCPVSNLRLRAVARLEDHPLPALLRQGLMVTVNSDDPAYFGAYLTETLARSWQAMPLTRSDIVEIIRNGFRASFLPPAVIARHLAAVDAAVADAT